MMSDQQLMLLASHVEIYSKLTVKSHQSHLKTTQHSYTSDRFKKEAWVKANCLTFSSIAYMYCWSIDVVIKWCRKVCLETVCVYKTLLVNLVTYTCYHLMFLIFQKISDSYWMNFTVDKIIVLPQIMARAFIIILSCNFSPWPINETGDYMRLAFISWSSESKLFMLWILMEAGDTHAADPVAPWNGQHSL